MSSWKDNNLLIILEKMKYIDGLSFTTDNGFIPTKSWMTQRYQEFNQLYFNNQLPKIEKKFKVEISSRFYGQTICTHSLNKNQEIINVEIESVSLALFEERTEEFYCNVLLHEMIHIYQHSILYIPGGHGETFIQEMNRINNFGWGVSINNSHMNTPLYSKVKKEFKNYKLLIVPLTAQSLGGVLVSNTSISRGILESLKNYELYSISSDEVLYKFPSIDKGIKTLEEDILISDITYKDLESMLNNEEITKFKKVNLQEKQAPLKGFKDSDSKFLRSLEDIEGQVVNIQKLDNGGYRFTQILS